MKRSPEQEVTPCPYCKSRKGYYYDEHDKPEICANCGSNIQVKRHA